MFTKEFWKAAGIRAIHAVAQSAIAMIGVAQVNLSQVDWLNVVSVAVVAGIISMLKSIAVGVPEVSNGDTDI